MATPPKKGYYWFSLVLILLLCLTALPVTHEADIAVSPDLPRTRGRGDIYWNETEGHPIRENYTVASDMTLRISPGVEVIFEGPYYVFVEGTLLAVGEVNNTISFSSGADYARPGDWGSIQFNSSSGSSSILENVVIEHAEIGITCLDSSPSLRNIVVMGSLHTGIYASGSGFAMDNGTISGNWGHGIHIKDSSPLVVNSSVTDNTADGIFATSNSVLDLRHNLLARNGFDGVHIAEDSYAFLENNSLSSNGHSGVDITAKSSTVISRNVIGNNSWYGIKIEDALPSYIDNNTVRDNGKPLGMSGVYVFGSQVELDWNYIAFNSGNGVEIKESSGSVEGNHLIANKAGIALMGSQSMSIIGNNIKNNVYGIQLWNSGPGIRSNIMKNNRFGIHSTDSHDVAIENNLISNAYGRDIMVGNDEGQVIYYSSIGDLLFERRGPITTTDQLKISVHSAAVPALADLNGDCILDIVIGNEQGFFHYFANTGEGYEDMGLLTEVTPLIDLNVGSYAHPFVTDWDLDGDLDLLIGRGDGYISYFNNSGADTFIDGGLLEEVDDLLNPGPRSAPFFVDWNDDGDEDLIVGNFMGNISWYENIEQKDGISFVDLGPLRWWKGGPRSIANQGNNIVPWILDWDMDFDLDLITSNQTGVYNWTLAPSGFFDPPVVVMSTAGEVSARASDWDDDGFFDLVVGSDNGLAYLYRNEGDNTFQLNGSFQVNAEDIDMGNWSSPFPVDWDGDSILDLVIGDEEGYLTLFLGNETGSTAMQTGVRLKTKGIPNAISTGNWSVPSLTDWNGDGDIDLIAGGRDGKISYFENNGNNEFVFQWNLSSNSTGLEVDVGQQSAPRLSDWDSNETLDLLLGDSDGYVHRFERISGDLRNLTDLGRLSADGTEIKVGAKSIPDSADVDEDGDLDLLVGDDQGKVHRFQREGGQLFYLGYLKSEAGDLEAGGYSAPLFLGWEFSSNDDDTRNGLFFDNSSAVISDNGVIRGGGGGYGISVSYSSIELVNNGWVGGGKGKAHGGSEEKSSGGGHGILAFDSHIQISNTPVYGGDGSDTSREKTEGGDGGIGIEMDGGTLEIIGSSIGGGVGKSGIVAKGEDGTGVSCRNLSEVSIHHFHLRGKTALMSSNTTIHLESGRIISRDLDLDLSNDSSALLVNTSFDKTRVLFRDLFSSLEVGWHLNALVLDNLSVPVPRSELTVWPGTFTTHGRVVLTPAIFGPSSPATGDLSSANEVDLIVGDGSGLLHYWIGGTFSYNGTLNKTGGVPVNVAGPGSPYLIDWDNDGDTDLVVGDGNGLVWRFNNTGNGIFEDGYALKLNSSSDVYVSGEASPAIIDWNRDSFLDVLLAGNGSIYYFQNMGDDTFQQGVKIRADGVDISHDSWSSLWPWDFDMDGLQDILVGTLDGKVALYLNDGNGNTRFGGYLKTNNSLLQEIDIGDRSKATAEDLDNDGYPDLLVGNSAGQISLFESNGAKDNVTSYTNLDGFSQEIQVLEYDQRDLNGDGDGEDEGEKTYLSPSIVQVERCNHTRSVAPLPHLEESVALTIRMEFNLGSCPPVVHSTYPAQDQKDVPVSADITITFDKNMDKTSVENASNVNPPITISQFIWPSNNVVILDIDSLDFDTEYTLTINGSIAKDTVGLGLDGNTNGISENSPVDDFELRFTAERIPAIISNSPQGPGQSQESTISFCFNKVMNMSSVEQFLSISPTVKWSAWWSQSKTCAYVDAELGLQTTYTVSVSGNSTDLNGNTLDGNQNGQPEGHPVDAFEWQFSTLPDLVPPKITATTPANWQSDVGLTQEITIEFSESIDPASLTTGLTVRNDTHFWDEGHEPGHSMIGDFGRFAFVDGNLTISDAALQYDATYQMTLFGNLATGITDLAGNPLDGNGDGSSEGSPADDFILTFNTSDPFPPKVVFVFPPDGEEGVELTSIVRATFDDDMDPLTLNDSTVLLLDDNDLALDANISYSPDNHTLLLRPNEALDFSTTYRVVISSHVQDTSHNTLDGNGDGIGSGRSYDNFSWSFTTIPDTSPPVLQILSPEENSLFTIGDIVNVTGIATDSDRVDRLEISIQFSNFTDITNYLNETDGTWFYELDTSDYDEGELRIQVRALDPSGNPLTQLRTIRLREPVTPFPIWIAILLTIIILVSATFGYRYFRSVYAERERVTERKRIEMEEMLKKLEEEHETLTRRAEEIEARELDLETKESYLEDLDAHYQSLAASLIERERIDLAVGENIVAQSMGERLPEIQRYEKAFILLSEAEASEAGEMTKKLPDSGKKALLLVYFNALEAYLRDKLKGAIPTGATILLGEKGHINTRSGGWEDKWSTLSLGTLTHAVDHNKHFFVEDEDKWEETKALLRETVEIRNLTAHPSEANPDVEDVREKVYSAILSLSEVLKRPREMKR